MIPGRTDPFAAFGKFTAAGALLGEKAYGALLEWIDRRLRETEGNAFRVTPFMEAAALAEATGYPGRVWFKNETGNVAGSHKGRHLMGTLLYLEAIRRIRGETDKRPLAVYSCGNAALAAAALARAGGYSLTAFVPETVPSIYETGLRERGARVVKSTRTDTGSGDPSYNAFRAAVNTGAVPFSCSGTDNWTAVEGGMTLGLETAVQSAAKNIRPDAVVLQVGGGMLARSVAEAYADLTDLGLSTSAPAVHVVQPEGGFPFVRAYYLALEAIAAQNGLDLPLLYDRRDRPETALFRLIRRYREASDPIRRIIGFIQNNFTTGLVQRPLEQIRKQRNRFMWPWDGPSPKSAAEGILDDETYDWYFLLVEMLKTGGIAAVADETDIRLAHLLSRRHTQIAVSATGTAGVAGLLRLYKDGFLAPGKTVLLFFTGIDRKSMEAAHQQIS
jgi:threonine synthase